MYKVSESLLSDTNVQEALEVVRRSKLGVRRTPCIDVSGFFFPGISTTQWSNIFMKCENMQNTGSFKIRGVAAQFEAFEKFLKAKEDGRNKAEIVTISAGNYGKSFAYAAGKLGLGATVIMPDTAPANKETDMKNLGVRVERMPSCNLMEGVQQHELKGHIFMHPFDDIDLISGHASLGKRLKEKLKELRNSLYKCNSSIKWH